MCRLASGRAAGVADVFTTVLALVLVGVAAALAVKPTVLWFASLAAAGLVYAWTATYRLFAYCSTRRSCMVCMRHRVTIRSFFSKANMVVLFVEFAFTLALGCVGVIKAPKPAVLVIWTVCLLASAAVLLVSFVFSICSWYLWRKTRAQTQRLVDGSIQAPVTYGLVDRADRTRTESDALASVLVLPKPTVDPPQTLLFVDEYHIKVNVPPDGDVAGMEIQYVLDDVVPRHLSEGKRFRSALKPRPGTRQATIRIRQSCRFVARLHAENYRDSEMVRARFVAVQPPAVIVTAGNALLVRTPCFAYLTGDASANRCVVVVGLEIKTGEGVNALAVEVPLQPVGNPGSGHYVWAIPAAPRVGPSPDLAPLLPDTKYCVRVLYDLDDTARYVSAVGGERLVSPWSVPVTTNPIASSQTIAMEKFSYLTRGKGLMFRRKEQVDTFRLTPERLMRGKKKGYSLPRCVDALQRFPAELGVVRVPDRTDERADTPTSANERQRLTHPDTMLCSEWETLLLFVAVVFHWSDQLTRRVALQLLRSKMQAVPRGYEELVWILRADQCPRGLTISDGTEFDEGGIDASDILSTMADPNFEAVTPAPPPGATSTRLGAGGDFGEANGVVASGDDLKNLLATLRRIRAQLQQRLAVANDTEKAAIKSETEALLRSFPPSMLAVAREFLSLRPVAVGGAGSPTSPTSPVSPSSDGGLSPQLALRGRISSITESLLGMMATPDKEKGKPVTVSPAAEHKDGDDDEDCHKPAEAGRLKKCSICYTEDVSAVYAPCGHAVCYTCGEKWARLKRTCHECRQPVDRVLRVFL